MPGRPIPARAARTVRSTPAPHLPQPGHPAPVAARPSGGGARPGSSARTEPPAQFELGQEFIDPLADLRFGHVLEIGVDAQVVPGSQALVHRGGLGQRPKLESH